MFIIYLYHNSNILCRNAIKKNPKILNLITSKLFTKKIFFLFLVKFLENTINIFYIKYIS